MPLNREQVSTYCAPEVMRVIDQMEDAGYPTFLSGKVVTQLRLGERPGVVELTTAMPGTLIRMLYPDVDESPHSDLLFLGSRGRGKHSIKIYSIAALKGDGLADAAQASFQTRPIRSDAVLHRLMTGESYLHPLADSDFENRVVQPVQRPLAYIQQSRRCGIDLVKAVTERSEFGFKLAPQVTEAIRRSAMGIRDVQPRVLRYELGEILTGRNPTLGLALLRETGILPELFPALSASDELFQELTDSISKIDRSDEESEILCWATFARIASLAARNREQIIGLLRELRFTAEKLSRIVAQMGRVLEVVELEEAQPFAQSQPRNSPFSGFPLSHHYLGMWGVAVAERRRVLNAYNSIKAHERPQTVEEAKAWVGRQLRR